MADTREEHSKGFLHDFRFILGQSCDFLAIGDVWFGFWAPGSWRVSHIWTFSASFSDKNSLLTAKNQVFHQKKWVFEFFDFWSYMGKKLMRFEWDHFQPDLRPKQCRNIDFKIFDFQIFQIFPDFLDFWYFFLGTQVWRTPHIKLMGGSGVSLKKKKVFFLSSKTCLKCLE